MRLLARTFSVTALCFYRTVSRGTDEAVRASLEGLGRISDVEAFPIPQDGHRFRFVWDHMRSVLSGRVYTRYVYSSEEYQRALDEALGKERFDVIHMDSLDLSAYLPELDLERVICTHHNVESALLLRRAENERFPLSAYLRHQARLMEREERRWSERVALNVVVSAEDGSRLSAIAPAARVTVVPNGVDTKYFQPLERSPSEGLVFVGGYSWYPNRDALHYFAERILPLIREKYPAVRVTWVGDAPPEVVAEFGKKHGITLTGFVDDVRPHIDAAACYVVPLRVGGGTRLKILDAWAMAKPVVSTSVGAEGLDGRDGENILLRDTPERFAAAVVDVLEDRDLRDRLRSGARATAEDVYEWDVIGDSMTRTYLHLAGRPAEAIERPAATRGARLDGLERSDT